MTLLWVAIGAAFGAPLRYVADRFVQSRHDAMFPWGTFIVNVTGSMILGVVAGLAVSGTVMTIAGAGFCGALTTYSTFSFESMRLWDAGAHVQAAANIMASLVVGAGAILLGVAVGEALIG